MKPTFLKDLAAKTHRVMRGRGEERKSGGGWCYGDKVVKQLDARGSPVRGDREINEIEAAIVRRVFSEFAAGTSPRTIARGLNAEAIPGPGGKPWNDITIGGHMKRITDIANNELYIGRLCAGDQPAEPGAALQWRNLESGTR